MTVYLVRHTEKETGPAAGSDPPLTEQGRRRAHALARALAGVELRGIYATQFRRTQQTVAPAATARGLTVVTVDADDVPGLVARIRAHAGGAALVAGHSNTVPAIAAALGVPGELVLRDADYGDLFVVRSAGSSATLERRRFDPA